VFPIVATDKDTGKYAKYSKQALRAVVDTLDEGGYPRRYRLNQEPYGFYDCQGHGVEVLLTDRTRKNADNPAEVDLVHRDFVQGLIAMGRELEVINLINATNIPQNVTLSGTSQWSNSASDPIAAIMAQIETILQNVPGSQPEQMRLLLPRSVWRTIKTNTAVKDYYKYTLNIGVDAKRLDTGWLAAALGIEKVVIADNVGLTSQPGQTDTLAFNWPSAPGNSIALLYYTTGTPAPLTPNFGYIFRSRIDFYPLREVRDEHGLGTLIISQESRDTLMIEPNAAFLWVNPI
ncbi:MAG TPA: hypothetical protein VKU93_02680, partial [Terracidiphilus sp.]|nr:hypothetical protein [Terracidiphilus sp.]